MSDAPVTATLNRRAVILGGVLTAAAATAYAATPRRAEHRLARQKLGGLISPAIGPWRYSSNEGVVVATEEGPVDGYDQVLTRVYDAPGMPSVMMLLAYGSTQGGSLQLHRPETCYPGQGFKTSDFQDVDFDFGPGRIAHARKLTARRDERIERLVYWTRIGQRFPRSTAEEYAAILMAVTSGVIPDGILVRLSTIGGDIGRSDRALADFASALVARSEPAGRSILIGGPKAQ